MRVSVFGTPDLLNECDEGLLGEDMGENIDCT